MMILEENEEKREIFDGIMEIEEIWRNGDIFYYI